MYPAGNDKWSWSWMGFSAPIDGYGQKLKPTYERLKHCFGYYCGIGEFSYWNRSAIETLSKDDKLILLSELVKDNVDKLVGRIYIGWSSETGFNKSIDQFADLKNFLVPLTTEECRNQKYPHNNRCRFDTGFFCEDCNTFFAKDSEDYIKYE